MNDLAFTSAPGPTAPAGDAHARVRRAARVVQLTDTHLFASAAGEFDGVNTHATLVSVLDHAYRCFEPLDLMVLTGDLVHEERREAYELLRSVLEQFVTPVCCIPGNHDDPGLMSEVLRARNIYLPRTVLFDHWRLQFLNTRIAGSDGGHLSADELARLEESLAAEQSRYTVVFLHHHPVAIGSPWMDAMGLDNAEELFAVVERHHRVRCLAWGHIHQEIEVQRGALKLLGTPSTCVQFAPGSRSYAKDSAAPGYRWFELGDDGTVRTGVTRVG
jgi:Icc protein